MKEFEEMTENEKEELLKQIQDLPNEKEGEDSSLDLFTKSFNELSQTWTDSLKELDTLYPNHVNADDSHQESKDDSPKWLGKIRNRLN